MRFLVTGGAGFLGSHLCRALLNANHEVVAVDNFLTGSKDNIRDLLENPNFEIVRHDITVPLFIETDGIFNLACPASPPKYQLNPVQTMKTNVLGAINVLDLALRLQVPILQASTSEIYGDPQVSPQQEDYWGNVNSIGIRSCYDEGKRAAETLFFDFRRQYGIDARVARIFNTYGPSMAIHDGRVVSNFIVQALKGEPLTVFGDGSQIRSLCYVDDLIDGLMKLFFSGKIESPVNLGNPEPISMLELASEIIELTNSNSQVEYLPLPSDDPLTREPDISRARELLKWEPAISRGEGLTKTIEYFERELLKR